MTQLLNSPTITKELRGIENDLPINYPVRSIDDYKQRLSELTACRDYAVSFSKGTTVASARKSIHDLETRMEQLNKIIHAKQSESV